jgi:hypothetical protein
LDTMPGGTTNLDAVPCEEMCQGVTSRTEETDVKRTLLVVTVFAVAMGFLEAAVVVYLRLHYYPNGFAFPLAIIPEDILLVEVAREVATIIMLAAVGWLAGGRFLLRFSFFSFAFGVWDIGYYLFLKITLDWPASLLTDDILFLIPLPWVGPVLAPVLVSLCLMAAALVVFRRESIGRPLSIAPLLRVLITLGGLVILFSFLTSADAVTHQQAPAHFHWLLFGAGVSLGAAAFVTALRK